MDDCFNKALHYLKAITICYFREECPDARKPMTLRTLLPPPTDFLPSAVHTSKNALFTITTQWAPSSHYHVSINNFSLEGASRIVDFFIY